LCQKKYFRGHLGEGGLGHIFSENAKFDLKGKKIDPLDCFFSQIIINIKNIYIYYKFIALKNGKKGFSPIFGKSTYFSSIERKK